MVQTDRVSNDTENVAPLGRLQEMINLIHFCHKFPVEMSKFATKYLNLIYKFILEISTDKFPRKKDTSNRCL